jgi:Leucine-rich repeat (LRR) protein
MKHHHVITLWIMILAGLAVAAIPASERAALVALYNATEGASWTTNTGWLGAAGTECEWYGITCDEGDNHVTRLDMPNNNMVGTLPPEIGQLTALEFLRLSQNSLAGDIPVELWNLGQCKVLMLGSNDFTGSLPAAVENMASLESLQMQINELTGPLPSQLGNLPELNYLDLAYNNIDGALPAELGNLSKLGTIWLQQNNLTGSIPPAIFELPNLTGINLSRNQLSGSLPTEIGAAVYLNSLSLGLNDLNGEIPTQIGNLTNLNLLYLNNNSLTGQIPSEIGHLTKLTQLRLDSNQLTGPVPPALGNMASLRTLRLEINGLTGSIPPELARALFLRELNLSRNSLSGTIPRELGGLADLETLFLFRNQLTGPIPTELGQLINLYHLELESNRLTGPVPTEITNLTNIPGNGIDLRYNALYTDDPAVQAFLDANQAGPAEFGRVQTTAPTDLSMDWDKDSGWLEWTPIPYSDSPGYYEFWGSAVSGGPYRRLTATSAKTTAGLYMVDLDQTDTLFLVMRTVSEPDVSNDNTVVSEFSTEVRLGPEVTQTRALAAHVADNEAWGSAVTVVNTGDAAQEVLFAAVNAAGELVETATWASLAAGASLATDVVDLFAPETLAQDVWIAVVGEGPLVGQVSFGTKDGETLVTIPVTEEWCTELVFPYVISSEELGYFTGITLVNTAPDHVVATLEAYTETGEKLDRVQVEIPGFGKYVRLLSGVFEVEDISQVRFVDVAAYRPLIAFELFGSYANAGMAGLPSFTPAAAATKSAQEVFYNVVPDNAAYYTGVTVSNLGTEDATLQAELRDAAGNQLVAADWPNPVAPGEQVTREVWWLFDGMVHDEAAWLKVEGDQPLLGFELLLSRDDGLPFRFDGLIGVNSGATDWIFPDVRTGPDWDSMLHLTNCTETAVTVTVTGYAADGTVTGVAEEVIPVYGQLASDVETMFPAAETAWIRVAATGEVVGDIAYVSADWTRMGSYIGLPADT